MSLSILTVPPETQVSLITAMAPLKLHPIATACHRDLNIIAYDHPPTAPLAASSDVPTSPPTSSSSEFSRQSSEKRATSPPRSRPVCRRQASISYLPPDSPRLWAPRTPILGSNSLKRSVSLSGVNNEKKDARAVTGLIHQRPAHEPAVLTLAEKCVSFSFCHSLSYNRRKNIFQGMRICSSLSLRKSPSASTFALSSRYTSLSFSNSSASGSAS
jgi:hypothetical protein